ncbi:MAG: hypothetical protein JWL67_519 [Solirubrobacterales bacterium]|nr:hypothetical protein [Solirubrobacterales bacterium]
MEIGAFFILLVVVGVVVVVGGMLYLTAAKLRRDKLHPERDRLADDSPERGEERPQHTRVTNEQRSEFLPNR